LQILSGRVESLPTAAVAYLSLPIHSWKEIRAHEEAGELVALWSPRDMKDEKEAKTEKEEKPAKEEKPTKPAKEEKPVKVAKDEKSTKAKGSSKK